MNKTALTPTQFFEVASHIKRTLPFISAEESLEVLIGKKPMDKSYAVLLVEDPYEKTMPLLDPILKELDIPACIMLSLEQLKTRSMPWTDEIFYKFNKTKLKEVTCSFFDRTLQLYTIEERLASAAHAISHLNHCDPETFKLRLLQLREILADVSWPHPDEQMLKLAKLKKYALKSYLTFGCAGDVRMPFFKINASEAAREIATASQELRAVLGDKLCPIYFYRSGLYRRKDKMITRAMREAGFLAAISDRTGVCRPGDNMFRLKHLPLAAGRNSFEKFELQGLANAVDEFLLVSLAQEEKY